MTAAGRLRSLPAVLVVFGLASPALGPLMIFWPYGWAWDSGHTDLLVHVHALTGRHDNLSPGPDWR